MSQNLFIKHRNRDRRRIEPIFLLALRAPFLRGFYFAKKQIKGEKR